MKFSINKAKEQSRGVFWVIDGELVAFQYPEDSYLGGISKSGLTFNHKRLWDESGLKNKYKKDYDYYPRGRVEFNNKVKPVIYMNPNIENSVINDIRTEFGLRENPNINLDFSDHYKCYLDK